VNGLPDSAASAFGAIGRAWRARDANAFNRAVHSYRATLESDQSGVMSKSKAETRFNSSEPFYTSAVLYVAAFLGGFMSWLKWPEAMRRTAFMLVTVAFGLTTAGIATRMWLEARPPVTNLYSSALFVSWGAVALCVILEYAYRNSIGSVTAGIVGFAALVIAHHLALGGDTMEMMRAVLDSNFWLATHVVTIAVGYSATFLAGFLALIYVVRGVATRPRRPALRRGARTRARRTAGPGT
jgi:ABC-type transport system involved in cytochrome c biogenesis permease subunit